MPRALTPPFCTPLTLAECIAQLDEHGFDPADELSLQHAASLLTGLAANRGFLGELLVDLLAGADNQASGYGPQAIMLAGPRNGYFLRANIWPARGDPAFEASGAGSFVYGLPHDHNFDFLTVGYFGPGYVSDYWEYDYGCVSGEVGECIASIRPRACPSRSTYAPRTPRKAGSTSTVSTPKPAGSRACSMRARTRSC